MQTLAHYPFLRERGRGTSGGRGPGGRPSNGCGAREGPPARARPGSRRPQPRHLANRSRRTGGPRSPRWKRWKLSADPRSTSGARSVEPTDRCQGRGRAAAEAREPGDRRTRGRPSQRAADIAPRKATQRIDTLRRDPTRVASEADEERRKSEEAGEEREQHDARIEGD